MYLSKISKQSISVIIPEVCKALIDSLSGPPTFLEKYTSI
nr:unnamed protein product [Callosobruchus chinensis]